MLSYIEMKKRIIFTDQSITEFCKATKDTNEVHDPAFMGTLGKRVIVPGMFAFACTAKLSSEFIKTRAGKFRVFFNTLLSSGDFADLVAEPEALTPGRIRLAAINHKDTLSSHEDYTFVESSPHPFAEQMEGTIISLPVNASQVEAFDRLTGIHDKEVNGFLFSVAYASHALYQKIEESSTEIEREIDELINGPGKVSPFYHTLEIFLPGQFMHLDDSGMIGYRIHFEREKKNRNYIANLQCEQGGRVLYRSVYKLVGIPDAVILRMAKAKSI